MTQKEFDEGVADLVQAGKSVILSRLERLTSYRGEDEVEEETRLDFLEQAQTAWLDISKEPEERDFFVTFFSGAIFGAYLMMAIFVSIVGGCV
jgi:hypothetical protein